MSLRTIRTRGGAPFTVSGQYADRFQGLLDDLEAAGYGIDPGQSGGYANRNIAGTNTLSNHAHGAAVDVNWSRNPRGQGGDIPPELARSLAAKHGMTWGGDWKNPDPMHFEVAGNVAPLSSGPTDPGYVPPDYNPAAPSVANGNAPPATGGQLQDIVADLFGGGQTKPQAQAKSEADLVMEELASMPAPQWAQMTGGRPKPVDVSHLREAILRRAQMREIG